MKKMGGEKLDPRNGAAGTGRESGRILNGGRAGGVEWRREMSQTQS